MRNFRFGALCALAMAASAGGGSILTGPAGRYTFDAPAPVVVSQSATSVTFDWSGGRPVDPPEPPPVPPVPTPNPPTPQQPETTLQAAARAEATALGLALATAAAEVRGGKMTTDAQVKARVAALRNPARTRFGVELDASQAAHLGPDGNALANPGAYAAVLEQASQAHLGAK
jgi:hypothetical protein